MKHHSIIASIAAAFLAPFASFADALENPRIVPFDSDATTGISSNKTYTHAVDFGTVQHEKPLTINGVEFFTTTAVTMPGDKTPRGHGWEGFPHAVNHPDPEKTMLVIATPKGESVRDLLLGHTWSLVNKYMYVKDLKPGFEYEIRFFNRVYGGGHKRGNTFVFKPDGDDPGAKGDMITFNQDDQSVKDNMLVYRYRAGASGKLAIYVECWDTVYTWHCYGFTNEEISKNIVAKNIKITGSSDAFINADVYPAGIETTVRAYWGATDRGESPEGWDGESDANGVFTKNTTLAIPVDKLEPAKTYVFRLSASNANSTTWSKPVRFTPKN